MLKEQAGTPEQPIARYLEHQHCEMVREIYQALCTASLDKFTSSWIESLRDELNAIVHELECLPEMVFKELVEVIDGLSEARNELRLARFLFEVAEVNPVYRLILRNRAVLRGRDILQKSLRVPHGDIFPVKVRTDEYTEWAQPDH